jgi:hypothetical protein
MTPTYSRHARSVRPLIRPRWLAVLAVVLVPVLSHPAAAQQRDRGSIAIFRNDAPETRTRVAYPAAAVWKALTEVYAEMGFALATTANIRGQEFLTPFMDIRGQLFGRRNSEFFTCQQFDMLGDLTNTGQLSFALRTRLEATDDGATVLHTQVDARARRRNTNTSAVDCTTTGKLEQALAQAVEQRLSQPAGQVQPK